MHKSFAVFALMMILLMPVQVKAQGDIGFDTLYVSVWPEYDTPSVLVIYRISLAPQTSLPAEFSLRLPANVGKLSAVAVGDSAESVSDSGLDYKFTPGTDFANVTIKAKARFIQIEYYDTNLTKSGSDHLYTYEWPAETSVNSFRFELRQPLQSSNLNVEPALSNVVVDNEGFGVSDFTQTGTKIGQKLTFKIKYQRDTEAPSTSFLKIQSSSPLDQTLPGQSNWMTYLPWGLGGLGLALLLIAGWVYWTTSRNQRANGMARKRHTGRAEIETGDTEQQSHCSQCGKRAQPGDRFCRACGARVRRNEE